MLLLYRVKLDSILNFTSQRETKAVYFWIFSSEIVLCVDSFVMGTVRVEGIMDYVAIEAIYTRCVHACVKGATACQKIGTDAPDTVQKQATHMRLRHRGYSRPWRSILIHGARWKLFMKNCPRMVNYKDAWLTYTPSINYRVLILFICLLLPKQQQFSFSVQYMGDFSDPGSLARAALPSSWHSVVCAPTHFSNVTVLILVRASCFLF